MFQPLMSPEDKVLSKEAAFEKSIFGSRLEVFHDDVYVNGEMGLFMVGTLRGGNEIEIGYSKIVEKYRRLIGDLIVSTGMFTVAQREMVDWL